MRPVFRAKRRSEARMAPNTELARLVREARAQSGLSLAEVAGYLDISAETLRAYETEAREIPLNHIYGLSNLLDISPRCILKVSTRSAPIKRVRG